MHPLLLAGIIGAAFGEAEKSGILAKVPHPAQAGPYATLAAVTWWAVPGNPWARRAALWAAGMAARQWATTGQVGGSPAHEPPY